MDMIAYIPFVFLGAFLGVFTIINFTILYFVQKKDHKKSARELKEYLHQNEIQKTNHDNSIFLRIAAIKPACANRSPATHLMISDLD